MLRVWLPRSHVRRGVKGIPGRGGRERGKSKKEERKGTVTKIRMTWIVN